MIRSFLAIDFPEREKEIIAGYGEELRRIPSKIKWVSAHQIHLTLKFFGAIDQETVERISAALGDIAAENNPFELTLKGIGAFPNLYRPRVIWMGMGGDIEALKNLQEGIEQTLAPLGIPREERAFHPHLTLGRNKTVELNEPLYQRLSRWPYKETLPFRVEALALYRSDLRPMGPMYTRLGAFPLKKN